MKLPGKEEYFNEIIESHMEEIMKIIKSGKEENERENILKKLERINFFVASPTQISLIINKGFIFYSFEYYRDNSLFKLNRRFQNIRFFSVIF